jgi:hypothetical protein
MADPRANDYIDRHGFRANVGIVLTRADRELFLGGSAAAGGSSRRAASIGVSGSRTRYFAS